MFLEPGVSIGWRPSMFNSLVVPRPIGWIGTVGRDGVPNLAPFSYFNALSSQPPMVMFCCNAQHAEGGEKDSLANARASGEFTANLVTLELAEAMNASSAPAPRAVDEFALAGLHAAAGTRVAAPGVDEAPVRLECRVVEIVRLPTDEASGQTNTMVIGRVVGVHIRDGLVDAEGRVDLQPQLPLARLGGLRYGVVETTLDMPRPAWPSTHGSAR